MGHFPEQKVQASVQVTQPDVGVRLLGGWADITDVGDRLKSDSIVCHKDLHAVLVFYHIDSQLSHPLWVPDRGR